MNFTPNISKTILFWWKWQYFRKFKTLGFMYVRAYRFQKEWMWLQNVQTVLHILQILGNCQKFCFVIEMCPFKPNDVDLLRGSISRSPRVFYGPSYLVLNTFNRFRYKGDKIVLPWLFTIHFKAFPKVSWKIDVGNFKF